jgi:hypothetical protein
VRRADAEHNRELFYALRGSGGGYAIVTAVELDLLPYAEVTAGALFFEADVAGRVLPRMAQLDDRRAGHDDHDVPRAVPSARAGGARAVARRPDRVRRRRLARPGGGDAARAAASGNCDPILGGFGPMPSGAIVRLNGDPEEPIPAIGDAILLSKLDDWAIESFLRVAGRGSPLLAAERRHLGGALATPPCGAGARGHLEGRFLAFGVGVPGAPAPADELEAHLDRFLGALAPWATGTRFTSFAERTSSLRTCVPDAAPNGSPGSGRPWRRAIRSTTRARPATVIRSASR